MKRYTRPSVAFILPSWARHQPKDFRLDYLLRCAIKLQWDLTPEGWTKAGEMGILEGFEMRPIENDESWGIFNSEAATRIHIKTFKQKSIAAAKTWLSRKVDAGEIKTNEKSGRKRRLISTDVDALIL